jgi:hypothetical protein
VNVAETDVSPVIVNVQVVVETVQAPPQPPNPAPAPGVAVRVTLELAATVAVQPDPPADEQLIAPAAPVTVPSPVTVTLSVYDDAAFPNDALTVREGSFSCTVQVVAVPEQGPCQPLNS